MAGPLDGSSRNSGRKAAEANHLLCSRALSFPPSVFFSGLLPRGALTCRPEHLLPCLCSQGPACLRCSNTALELHVLDLRDQPMLTGILSFRWGIPGREEKLAGLESHVCFWSLLVNMRKSHVLPTWLLLPSPNLLENS